MAGGHLVRSTSAASLGSPRLRQDPPEAEGRPGPNRCDRWPTRAERRRIRHPRGNVLPRLTSVKSK